MRFAITTLIIGVLAIGGVACKDAPPPKREPYVSNNQALVTVHFYKGDTPSGSCGGVLIGPQAVLTAGHCAAGKTRAVVVAPNAKGKKAHSERAWWFDWTENAKPSSSPQLHDITILTLDTRIELP